MSARRSSLQATARSAALPIVRAKVLAKTLPKGMANLFPSAFRVPAKSETRTRGELIQFPKGNPALYVHEGAREALVRRFVAVVSGPVLLSITDNRHAMISRALSKGCLVVRVHHMFLDAPVEIQEALVRYVAFSDRASSQLIGDFIALNGARLARRAKNRIPLETKGAHHDLLEIATTLQERYFPGTARPLITWGLKSPRRERKTIRLGSYDAQERLVRIHRVLDRPWVPRYFIACVVFHELLHHHLPATTRGGRRALHPPEFLEMERSYRFHERAMAWERRNRARLLRS
jgi:hypothetical protein